MALVAVMWPVGLWTYTSSWDSALTAHLIKGARARQVALAQAMWAFTAWTWTAAGDWLVGVKLG